MKEHIITYPSGSITVKCGERTDEREQVAARINNTLAIAKRHSWPKPYVNALRDLQKTLGIRGTYLELIV